MRRLLAGAACLVVLTGCSSSLSPKDTIKDQTAQLLDAANAGSVNGVHSAAATLRTTIQDQLASGALSATQADTLRTLLAKIENEADLLVSTPPTTPPPATATATQSPTPSPTPSKSPTPSPTPSYSPPPSPTQAPTTPPPTLGVGLGGSPSPAAT